MAQGIAPFERARHLFVRHDGKLARYRADTRDFDDATLVHIKHAAGQVYLDASRKAAPDDFARDLVKLRRAALCRPCPERDTCTGLFEADLEPVFERDEQSLREALGEARGDVLEIGCGDGRLASAWRPGIGAGTVRYCGIDPDAEALDRLRARLAATAATLLLGDAEDVLPTLPDRSVDHVVVAHAWNHLRDPGQVVAAVCRVLRPGGTLWIADDVPFGLARTPRQQRAAHRSRATWMHLRNHDAGQADDHVRRCGSAGLTLLERRDVGPDTSNQWLLRYRWSPA